jgi:hypothetical protein
MRWDERLDRENMALKSAIMDAGAMLVKHYPGLLAEQQARPTAGLLKLIEAAVADLLDERRKRQLALAEIERLSQQVKDEKYRTAKAREDSSCLSLDLKSAYREIERLKRSE